MIKEVDTCNSRDFMHTDGLSRSLHLPEKKIFSMYSVKTDVPSLVDNISSDISDNEIVVAWKKHRA